MSPLTAERIIAPMTALMIPATKLPVRDPIRGNDALPPHLLFLDSPFFPMVEGLVDDEQTDR